MRVKVKKNAEGIIIEWGEDIPEYDGEAYELPDVELSRFDACSGNLYKTVGGTLVYDESLPIIIYPVPKTALEILQETVDALVLSSLEVR